MMRLPIWKTALFAALLSGLCLVLGLALGSAPAARAQSASLRPPKGAVAQYNPMLAAHDVEVGKFYSKNGDLDAAISRFKDAIIYKPDYAEPRLLLGEAYEKKNEPKQALRYYREYLKILPNTKEAKKVRERVAKLEKETAAQSAGKATSKPL